MADYDMRRVMSFLTELASNNNKQWFDAHKPEFKAIQSIYLDFSQELLDGIKSLDDDMAGLELKQCTYRFYRDIRFSKDKSPYKTHLGTFIAKGGKCNGHSGYYFHIEPQGLNYIGGNMMSVGVYCPEPFVVKSIREEFEFNGTELVKNIEAAKDFSLSWDDSLKKVPKGFNPDDRYAEYYKLKSTLVERSFSNDFLFSKDLVKKTLDYFAQAVAFNRQLNKAIDFAYEEYAKK